jgi:hypothetical protein
MTSLYDVIVADVSVGEIDFKCDAALLTIVGILCVIVCNVHVLHV